MTRPQDSEDINTDMEEESMARISEFVRAQPERSGVHPTESTCAWSTVDAGEAVLLQLSTYGSDARQKPGGVTQTIQLTEDQAVELLGIMKQVFPRLDT